MNATATPHAVREFLLGQGVPEEEFDQAEQGGWLHLLVLDRLLLPGLQRYSLEEVAARAGVDVEAARRLWRAMGFPDVAPGERVFTDDDVEALAGAAEEIEQGNLDVVVQTTRAINASVGRIAEIQSDAIRAALVNGEGADPAALVTGWAQEWPRQQQMFDYFHRRQLHAAAWRKLATPHADAGETMAVGFADMVGFTALARRLSAPELSGLIARFEDAAHEAVTIRGGRVVKTLGDEVMFATADAGDALRIALDLAAVHDADPSIPPARVGVALGPVLARGGDYYGPVVNLAHRISDVAHPGAVLVADELHRERGGDPGLEWQALGTRPLAGIGRVRLWVVRRERADRMEVLEALARGEIDVDEAMGRIR